MMTALAAHERRRMLNTPPCTFRELLDRAITPLVAVTDNPRLDAELLLAHAIDRPRTHLRAWPDNRPEPGELARFEQLLERRLRGEPMAYLLGEREFWSLTLRVTPDTLIPRPDTEILVEAALQKIPRDGHCRVLDLGTGSGAIALALKSERPLSDVMATDASRAALDVARDNAERLGLDVRFLHGDWWEPVAGMTFDVAVSNPPYIPGDDPHLSASGLPFEPRTALVAGRDGLDDIRRIAEKAPAFLSPGGWLLVEHGHDQSAAVRELLVGAGLRSAGCLTDIAGHERVSFAQRGLAPEESA